MMHANFNGLTLSLAAMHTRVQASASAVNLLLQPQIQHTELSTLL
jgi:hypothetical protein